MSDPRTSAWACDLFPDSTEKRKAAERAHRNLYFYRALAYCQRQSSNCDSTTSGPVRSLAIS